MAKYSIPNLDIRHACDQNDNMDGYGWSKHDGRRWGRQIIKDPFNNLIITTEWIKIAKDGAADGGDWVLRVSGEAIDESRCRSIC